MNAIREADVIVHVLRSFENDEIVHVDDGIDVKRDLATVDLELLLADLQVVETRLERIAAQGKKKLENPREKRLLERVKEQLEDEIPVGAMALDDADRERSCPYHLPHR